MPAEAFEGCAQLVGAATALLAMPVAEVMAAVRGSASGDLRGVIEALECPRGRVVPEACGDCEGRPECEVSAVLAEEAPAP